MIVDSQQQTKQQDPPPSCLSCLSLVPKRTIFARDRFEREIHLFFFHRIAGSSSPPSCLSCLSLVPKRIMMVSVMYHVMMIVNPFRTAVPFWGQNSWNLTGLSPKRDCGPKRVKTHVSSFSNILAPSPGRLRQHGVNSYGQ